MSEEKRKAIEDRIAQELGLSPEAVAAFKEMGEQMDKVLTEAEGTLVEDAGIDPVDLFRMAPEWDEDVQYVMVGSPEQGVPVYRAQFCYFKDGVRLIGSWLPNGLTRLDAN